MISVEEAKRLVMAQVALRMGEYQLLDDAVGRVLAEDAIALYDHPLFDMSAVDGYALGDAAGPWKVVGSIAAGDVLGRWLNKGECVRIFTGAHVPADSHAVVMQEHCRIADGALVIKGTVPTQGANIRRKAESSRAGDVLLRKGTRLDPVGVGLLASCGMEDVSVTIEPAVSIVRTGGEFIEGVEPQPGRIFSSNEWMLIAAVRSAGFFTASDAFIANDTEPELRAALLNAIEEGDVVITTGGASVGDHDLVLPVLKKLGASVHFHGVAQKPGKPMLFATLKGVPVFALPGNPRAVMICFWEYILPFLRAMQGAADPWLKSEPLPLTHSVELKGERAEFRAAQVRAGRVTLLADEGSHMLRSLVAADALAYFPSDRRSFKEGDPVEIHYLPR